ncbi:MAG: hypothetical protein V3U64_05295 [Cocleimonas sp.]
MDAEIRFFMTTDDEADFLQFANKHVDEIVKGQKESSGLEPKQRFILGDCELLYTPTLLEENTLYSGVLEIRIEAEDTCKNQLRANSTYKKLRNWIKKKYWSRLAFINKNKNDRLMPSRIHWLGPDAKKWKEENSEKHVLKLSKTSWMAFEIGF